MRALIWISKPRQQLAKAIFQLGHMRRPSQLVPKFADGNYKLAVLEIRPSCFLGRNLTHACSNFGGLCKVTSQSWLLLQAEFYMGMQKWNKAEMALQRILSREPEHEVALYQLSQVYLEQNKTRLALEAIKSAAKSGCSSSKVDLKISSSACIWGANCKAHLCTQIVIQEADILRTMRLYKLAAQVLLKIFFQTSNEAHKFPWCSRKLSSFWRKVHLSLNYSLVLVGRGSVQLQNAKKRLLSKSSESHKWATSSLIFQ